MQRQLLSDMVVLIPITTTQIGNIGMIISAMNMQTTLPGAIVFVFDRVDPIDLTKYSNCEYSVYGIRSDIPGSDSPKYREGDIYAGHTRNTGINFIASVIPEYAGIILIDGDCIPQPELIDSHKYILDYNDLPILSCGKRREENYRWRDRRETNHRLRSIGIFNRDIIINDVSLLKDALIVWSCNIAMNRRCIKLISDMNKKYYGRYELFNSNFNGGCGGEDSFLGVMAHVCRIFIHVVAKGGVEHIYHPPTPPDKANESYEFFKSMMDAFKVKIVNNPPSIDLFSAIHR